MPSKLLDKALKSVGGLEEFKRRGDQFRQDLAFIDENREKLLEQYNETWVAAHKCKIVAHGKDYNKVLSRLQMDKLPVDHIPIRYLSKQKVFALYITSYENNKG